MTRYVLPDWAVYAAVLVLYIYILSRIIHYSSQNYLSQFFSQKSQVIADYKNINLTRKQIPRFLQDGFSTHLARKTEFLNLGFCSILFKF